MCNSMIRTGFISLQIFNFKKIQERGCRLAFFLAQILLKVYLELKIWQKSQIGKDLGYLSTKYNFPSQRRSKKSP